MILQRRPFLQLNIPQVEFHFIHKLDVPVFPLLGNGITIFPSKELEVISCGIFIIQWVFVKHLPGTRLGIGNKEL